VNVPSGQYWLRYVVPEDRHRVVEAFQKAAARGGDFNEEFRVVTADGAVRWITCIGRVELGPDGKASRMQGVNIDITDRKHAEALLRRSEEQFRTISHAVPAMVWVASASGDMIFMNDRWHQFTGQTEAQAMGEGWTAAVHPDDAPALLAHWQQCRASGETCEGEYRLRGRDGKYRWHAFRALPHRSPTGGIERWIGCSIDIHDAREA